MSSTDELKALLDERNVEYKERDMYTRSVFHWGEPLHGAMFTASGEWTELVVENPTPQQAIDATLGRGECRRVMDSIDLFNTWVCDHCGHPLDASDNFCCGCGWKVKQ